MVVIVISGMPGCGSSTTAKLLAEKLEIAHYSVGDYNKSHTTTGTETQKSITMWTALKGKLLRKFHVNSDKIARQVAKGGNVVIDGKVAIRMIKGKYDMSIWLKTDEETRAKRYAKRDDTDIKASTANLLRKERLERRNFRRIYGFDYFDQEKEADLVIDTGDKTPGQIVEEIISRAKEKQILKELNA
jgi:predicted cytidylate kinase